MCCKVLWVWKEHSTINRPLDGYTAYICHPRKSPIIYTTLSLLNLKDLQMTEHIFPSDVLTFWELPLNLPYKVKIYENISVKTVDSSGFLLLSNCEWNLQTFVRNSCEVSYFDSGISAPVKQLSTVTQFSCYARF